MNPARAIAMLDKQIAAHGQRISFKRGTSGITTRCFVREYKPDELVGLITQQDRLVVLSPSDLGAYGIPKAQDLVATGGQQGIVQSVGQTHINDVLVRLDLRVRMT